MKNNLKTYEFLILVILASNICAQEKNVSYENQQWAQYYGQLLFSDKWSLVADCGMRRRDCLQEWSQTLVRGGVMYSLNTSVSFAGGMAYFTSFTENTPSRDEKRLWLEMAFKQTAARFNFQQRLRLEDRFFHTFHDNSFNSNYRARYRFYLTIPINHNSLLDNTFFIAGGDEIFINFGKEINHNMFDQNRLLAGVGYKLNQNFQFSISYVYQYAQKSKPLSFEKSEVFWLSINHKMQLKYKNRSETK